MTAMVRREDFDQLQGFDPAGRPDHWWVCPVGVVPASLSALTAEEIELSDGKRLLRKSLPTQVDNDSVRQLADRQLDNEIRALVRLATRYPDDYPAELPKVVGYNYDAASPFLLTTPHGRDVVGGSNGLRTLMVEERKAFQIGLFRALAALEAVDLVHGGVTLHSLRWTGDGGVQLTGFEHAVCRGELVLSRQITVALEAQARRPADPADDVRDAGIALYELAVGRRPTDRELADEQHIVDILSPALSGVFNPVPENRPTAAEVLQRLGDVHPLADPIDVDVVFRAGYERFDSLRPPPEPPDPYPSPPEPPAPPARRLSKPPRALVLAVSVVVFVAIMLLVLRVWW